MAKTNALRARLAIALVLAGAAMGGVACAPTPMPLPMLAAGYSPAHASANHEVTHGGEVAAASPTRAR